MIVCMTLARSRASQSIGPSHSHWGRVQVVTVTLSLSVLLICHLLTLESHSDMDSDPTPKVARYVCMGCMVTSTGRQVQYFPTYKAAACHWARSPACNQSGRTIRIVPIESRPGDRDAGGSGAAGTWVPRNPAGKGMNKCIGYPCYITLSCI